MKPSANQCYGFLPGFTEFSLLIPGITQPSLSCTEILLSLTAFLSISIGFHSISTLFRLLYWVLPSFTEFYRVLPSFTKFFEAFHEGIGDHLGKGNSTADLNEKKRKEIKTRENTNIFFRQ